MSTELPLQGYLADADDGDALLETSLRGEVLQVVYASEDGSYAVVRVRDGKVGDEKVMVGPLAHLAEGQPFEAWGSWERHKTYGRQFRATHCQAVLPATREGMLRYLGSGAIPGVGPKLAERIVNQFGDDTRKVLEQYSARLLEVPGFGKAKLQQFRTAWAEQHERREIFIFLQGLGLTPSACERIFRKYGAETIELVRENPFRLASDIRGIGFRTADGVARRLEMPPDHPCRLSAGIAYVLDQLCWQDGHTCVPRHLVLERTAAILEVEPAWAEEGLRRAVAEGTVTLSAEGLPAGEELVYLTPLYQAERELAQWLKLLLAHPPAPLGQDAALPVSERWGMLNQAQREAVRAAFAHGVTIITGGPGVGKTTVTREIVHLAQALRQKLALAAPTGRAAKRLAEATRQPARTLHRLLRWEPESQGFVHGPDTPLPVDLLIVDEVSMVDLRLATHLFRAVGLGTRVVLVGDRDQLPSVGPGAVLRDLLASRQVPATHLHEVYRQEADSRIIAAAHAVNHGELPPLGSPRDAEELRDFYWIDQEDPDKVVELIRRLVVERIPARFGLDPREDIQVLAPMNRGTCGAHNLNRMLQEALNPNPVHGLPELYGGEFLFRPGDRVMQVVNNYEHGIFNGDLGFVHEVDLAAKQLTVQFDSGPVPYGSDEFAQLRLAYAITIHKSQGCEFPAVVVPLLTQHYVMLRRQLVYTAMTRPSKLLVLVGSRRALQLAVSNHSQVPRYSRLQSFLRP